MLIAVSVVALTVLAGVTAGAAAGYVGGALDAVVYAGRRHLPRLPRHPAGDSARRRARAEPGKPGDRALGDGLGWGPPGSTRAQVLGLREREYVTAARALGAGPWRIVARHILPNALSPVIVQATFSAAGVIIAESSLLSSALAPKTCRPGAACSRRGPRTCSMRRTSRSSPGCSSCSRCWRSTSSATPSAIPSTQNPARNDHQE